jgi:hypothetical protein
VNKEAENLPFLRRGIAQFEVIDYDPTFYT